MYDNCEIFVSNKTNQMGNNLKEMFKYLHIPTKLNVLLIDNNYIKNYTAGIEEFKLRAAKFDIVTTSRITGLQPKEIENFAKLHQYDERKDYKEAWQEYNSLSANKRYTEIFWRA